MSKVGTKNPATEYVRTWEYMNDKKACKTTRVLFAEAWDKDSRRPDYDHSHHIFTSFRRNAQ